MEHIAGTEPLALRLGLRGGRFVGRSVDLVVMVVLGFVVGLLVDVVVVFLTRILGVLSVVALRGCCCRSSSLGPLASGGAWGGRSDGGRSTSSRRLSLAASRCSHADTVAGSVVDQEARDAGSERCSADGFPFGLEVFGGFGPVDLDARCQHCCNVATQVGAG